MENVPCFAADLLKRNCVEFYNLSSSQYTIIPTTKNVESIVNKCGLQMYQAACSDYNQNRYKDQFTSYCLINDNSGSWFANPESPFYDDSPNALKGMLNTFKNVLIWGFTEKSTDIPIRTSQCVFLERGKWALTKSGSFYRLDGVEHNYIDFSNMINKDKMNKNKKK